MDIGGVLSRLFADGKAPDWTILLDALMGWRLVVMEEVKVWKEYQRRSAGNAIHYLGDSTHCRAFTDPNTMEIVVRYSGLSDRKPDTEALWHEIYFHILKLGTMEEHEAYQVKP